MARLTVDAINPELIEPWPAALTALGVVRWELTCGFCRTRFRRTVWMIWSLAACRACGTRNDLEYRPGRSEPQR
jgi:hypothetical protein